MHHEERGLVTFSKINFFTVVWASWTMVWFFRSCQSPLHENPSCLAVSPYRLLLRRCLGAPDAENPALIYLDALPRFLDISSSGAPDEDSARLMVDLLVWEISSAVFVGVFDRRHAQNKQNRQHRNLRGDYKRLDKAVYSRVQVV